MVERKTTTSIEIDSALLRQLRARHPGKDDRELIEEVARVDLGFTLLGQAQKRNALSEEDAIALGVRAVHESRLSR